MNEKYLNIAAKLSVAVGSGRHVTIRTSPAIHGPVIVEAGRRGEVTIRAGSDVRTLKVAEIDAVDWAYKVWPEEEAAALAATGSVPDGVVQTSSTGAAWLGLPTSVEAFDQTMQLAAAEEYVAKFRALEAASQAFQMCERSSEEPEFSEMRAAHAHLLEMFPSASDYTEETQ